MTHCELKGNTRELYWSLHEDVLSGALEPKWRNRTMAEIFGGVRVRCET